MNTGLFKPSAQTAAHSWRQAVTAVSAVSGVPVDLIEGRSKAMPQARARQVALYLAWLWEGGSTSTVGAAAGRDHTTVWHASNVVRAAAPDSWTQRVVRSAERYLREKNNV